MYGCLNPFLFSLGVNIILKPTKTNFAWSNVLTNILFIFVYFSMYILGSYIGVFNILIILFLVFILPVIVVRSNFKNHWNHYRSISISCFIVPLCAVYLGQRYGYAFSNDYILHNNPQDAEEHYWGSSFLAFSIMVVFIAEIFFFIKFKVASIRLAKTKRP